MVEPSSCLSHLLLAVEQMEPEVFQNEVNEQVSLDTKSPKITESPILGEDDDSQLCKQSLIAQTPPSTPISSPGGSDSNDFDGDDEPNMRHPRKKRRRLKRDQLKLLLDVYDKTPFPSLEVRESLGQQLGMSARCIQIWFQNRRQNYKNKKPVVANENISSIGGSSSRIGMSQKSDSIGGESSLLLEGLTALPVRLTTISKPATTLTPITTTTFTSNNLLKNSLGINIKCRREGPSMSGCLERPIVQVLKGVERDYNRSLPGPGSTTLSEVSGSGSNLSFSSTLSSCSSQQSFLCGNSNSGANSSSSPTDSAINLYSPELMTLSSMFDSCCQSGDDGFKHPNNSSGFSGNGANLSGVKFYVGNLDEGESLSCIPSPRPKISATASSNITTTKMDCGKSSMSFSYRIPSIANLLNPIQQTTL